MPFYWIGRPQKVTYFDTENPEDEIWDQLSVLKYKKFIRRETPSFDERKIAFITGSFTQAFEYREAAKNSTDHTKPLLLYYCFMNLTKAVLAALEYDDISPYHGLKRPSVKPENLRESTVLVDDGVFMSMAKYLNIEIPRDFVVKIDRVLSRIPELKTVYEYSYKTKSEVIIPKVRVAVNGQFIINIPRWQLHAPNDFKSNWKTLFPGLREMFDLSGSDDRDFILKMKSDLLPDKNDKDNFIRTTGSRLFDYNASVSGFVPGLIMDSEDYNWPKVCFYYVILYFLSMIVRYEPDTWYQSVVDDEKGEIWIMSKFCKIAKRVFPNLLYNMLFGSDTVFRTSGSW